MSHRLSSTTLSFISSIYPPLSPFFFFFFNDTATTEIYTLSLHDALPILCWSGFDVIVPFGCYSGGWLEFPELGIQIASRQGGLLFIRGAALLHDAVDWSSDGVGEGRMVFTFFSDR